MTKEQAKVTLALLKKYVTIPFGAGKEAVEIEYALTKILSGERVVVDYVEPPQEATDARTS